MRGRRGSPAMTQPTPAQEEESHAFEVATVAAVLAGVVPPLLTVASLLIALDSIADLAFREAIKRRAVALIDTIEIHPAAIRSAVDGAIQLGRDHALDHDSTQWANPDPHVPRPRSGTRAAVESYVAEIRHQVTSTDVSLEPEAGPTPVQANSRWACRIQTSR